MMCPNWPVVAALSEAKEPAAAPAITLKGSRVTAVSVAAHALGVRVGMRQRDAQAACPELVLLGHDPARDTRMFEPVVAAVEDLVAGIQVVRPGLAVFAASGPVRYFGGEDAVAERLLDNIAAMTEVEAFVGFAEGVFAAALAAAGQVTVPAGRTRSFLAERDIAVLGRPQLISVLRRCGVNTLGALAALPEKSVTTRFGADGMTAHQLATAAWEAPISARTPEDVIEARMELDPPAARIQHATAAVHTAAERFQERLERRGLVCTVLRVDATIATGEVQSRAWRADEVFTIEAAATRLRWQLEAWLSSATRPTAGISALALVAEQVAPTSSRQLGLWGESGDKAKRAAAAIDRTQDLLGIAAVTTATLSGGRLPHEQVVHTAWRDDPPAPPDVAAAWPGRVPVPVRLFRPPLPVELWDGDDTAVDVDARHLITAAPTKLRRAGTAPARVLGWAGPWPIRERWWERTRRQGSWTQLVVEGSPGVESALLLFHDQRRWWLVGCYD